MNDWLKNIERLSFKSGSNFQIMIDDFIKKIPKSIELSREAQKNSLFWIILLLSLAHFNRISALTITTITNSLLDEPCDILKNISTQNIDIENCNNTDFVLNLLSVYSDHEQSIDNNVQKILRKHFNPQFNMDENMDNKKPDSSVLTFLDAKIKGERKTVNSEDLNFSGFADMRKKKLKTLKDTEDSPDLNI